MSTVQGLSRVEFRPANTSEKFYISKHKSCIVSTCSVLPTGGSNAYSQPAIASCYKSCASGPRYIEHYQPGYLFWPPIRYKTCDGLTCGYKRRCMPRRTHQRRHTVCVYKCGLSGCTFDGIKYVTYTEHLDCQCECQTTGVCSCGYVWSTKHCRCVRKPYCFLPGFYYNPIFCKCMYRSPN